MSRGERALLLGLLALAAALRFWALDWGLTRTPHVDEAYFVGNAARMLATGSLDHGYYEYPGLIFYLLVPVLKLVGCGDPPSAAAYLAARAFIATCGVLAVALCAHLGRRLAGTRAGLCAAALLAVSPVHVEAAHMFRPDVTLELFLLLLFLACLRVGMSPRADGLCGVALGLAVGTKFSGALGLVPYLLRRLAAPGPRWRGLALAGVAAAAVFVLVSPYALVHQRAFGEGVAEQLRYHYERDVTEAAPYPLRLLGYASVWLAALGPLGVLLAAGGVLVAVRRDARNWLPLLSLPPLTAAVFASTDFHFDRHMLPSMSVVALLAGLALQSLAERRARLALVLALLAPAWPLRASLRYLEEIQRPTTRDRAVDWLNAHVPAPARVLTSVNSLGLDRKRFEIVRFREPGALFELQARDADAIVSLAETEDRAPLAAWPLAQELQPGSPYEGPTLFVRLRQGPRVEPRWLTVADAQLEGSDNAQDLDLLRDGRLDTFWRVPKGEARRAWLRLRFAKPVRLQRLELLLGELPHLAGQSFRLQVSSDGNAFRPWPVAAGRPAPADQHAGPPGPSELLLFPPVEVLALRLERHAAKRPWGVAELRVAP